jgi:hypothetical protein
MDGSAGNSDGLEGPPCSELLRQRAGRAVDASLPGVQARRRAVQEERETRSPRTHVDSPMQSCVVQSRLADA